jgi:alkylation response protein AidB-like acyl-CoA dehydrogenase
MPHTLLDAAAALDPQLRAASQDVEDARRLPPPLVDALTDAGFFRICVPESIGGLECDVATTLECIECISIADGSAGWCVMIGGTTGLVAAFLEADAAKEIFGDPRVVTGGMVAPGGTATRTDGGYRVNGHWTFGSGSGHCQWLGGGCIPDDARPPLFPMMPVRDLEILDTWHVSGLRGTGSNDFTATDLFVPESHTVCLFTDRPREDGPLYRFPLFCLLALGVASVSLGIGRRAIDELVALADSKRPTGSRRTLAQRATIQVDLAKAEAGLRSARALFYDTVAKAWDVAANGDAIPIRLRADLRLAATNVARTAAGVTTSMYEAGGGTAIYAGSPLQRCFRDAHTATQHVMVAPATYELVGRILLGLDTDTSTL